MPTFSGKVPFRAYIKAVLATLPPEEFAATGMKAARLLSAVPGWDAFRSVLAFLSLPGEIDTRPILKTALDTGKRLFAPRIEETSLVFYRMCTRDPPGWRKNRLGIREPGPNSAPVLSADDFPVLVITPGLAFDGKGRRLGRGGGYYDRFFAALDKGTRDNGPLPYIAAGLCLDCQIVERVPAATWDKAVDFVITEMGLKTTG